MKKKFPPFFSLLFFFFLLNSCSKENFVDVNKDLSLFFNNEGKFSQTSHTSLDLEDKRWSNIESFKAKVFVNLMTTHKVNFFRKNDLNSDKIIDPPHQLWLPLFRFETLAPKEFRSLTFCFFYRSPKTNKQNMKKEKGEEGGNNIKVDVDDKEEIPKIEELGILKLVQVSRTETCEKNILEPPLTQLEGIKNLKVFLSDHQDPKNEEFSRAFHLSFKMLIWDSKERGMLPLALDFPLYNLIRGVDFQGLKDNFLSPSTDEKHYHSSVEIKLIPGVNIMGLKTPDETFPLGKIGQIGQSDFLKGELIDSLKGDESHLLSNNAPIKCHEINDSCESVTPFTCDQCRFGWFEVVGKGCPKGGDKYCGISRCGEKGRPACPRGQKLSRYGEEGPCPNQGTLAFCEEGLVQVCNDEGMVVCQ